MKSRKLNLMFAILALTSLPGFAQRRSPYVKIDLTKKFADASLNLMGDDNYGAEGADLLLRGVYKKDFALTLKSDGPDVECRIMSVRNLPTETGSTSVVRVRATPEVDDGSECRVLIQYRSGARAVFSMYATGT